MQTYQQAQGGQTAVATIVAPLSRSQAKAMATYRKEEFTNLTPVQVIEKLYDVAIVACKKQDNILARKAINELIAGLNFEHKEIALGLYKLYDYAKYCLRIGKTSEAVKVLEELRSAWSQAFGLRSGMNTPEALQ